MPLPARYPLAFTRRTVAALLLACSAAIPAAAGVEADWHMRLLRAGTACDERRYPEALASASELLKAVDRPGAPASEDLAAVLTLIGRIHSGQGRYDEAQPYFVRALDLDVQMHGENSQKLQDALMYLAGNYVRRGDPVAAEKTYLRLVAIQEKALGANHVDLLTPLRALAHLYLQQQRMDEARGLVKRMLGLWDTPSAAVFGADRDGRTHELQSLGALEAAEGHLDEALRLHEQALKRLDVELDRSTKKWGTPGNGTLARSIECLERLAVLSRRMDRARDAQQLESRAAALRSQMQGAPMELPDTWAQGLLPLPR